MKSKKHWWREFSFARRGTGKICIAVSWSLRLGTKQSNNNCKSSLFLLIIHFFCNCKCLPNKYWVFTQNHFTFFINHSNTMKLSSFPPFYKMTHDTLSGHLKKKAVVEPGVKDSDVRCDRNLDWQMNWQWSWLF